MDVDFTQRTTAFVGVNGVGKSAILDALAIALSQLIWRLNNQPQKARPIALDDIRHGADFARIAITLQIRPGVEIQWALARNRKAGTYPDPLRKSDLEALNRAVSALNAEWEHIESERPEPYDLPLAVYYDVNRSVLEIPIRVREKLQNTPYEVYRDALDHGGADFKRFFIWFRNREDYENEQRRDQPDFRDRALEAVRAAVAAFTGFQDLRIRRSPLRMTVVKQGLELNVAQLSDGERNMLAPLGDDRPDAERAQPEPDQPQCRSRRRAHRRNRPAPASWMAAPRHRLAGAHLPQLPVHRHHALTPDRRRTGAGVGDAAA
ncbi:MAG: AAA family ATPase [Chromatiales bacterium]|nr:AAA family ATPase [Chromatiales bacterium]